LSCRAQRSSEGWLRGQFPRLPRAHRRKVVELCLLRASRVGFEVNDVQVAAGRGGRREAQRSLPWARHSLTSRPGHLARNPEFTEMAEQSNPPNVYMYDDTLGSLCPIGSGPLPLPRQHAWDFHPLGVRELARLSTVGPNRARVPQLTKLHQTCPRKFKTWAQTSTLPKLRPNPTCTTQALPNVNWTNPQAPECCLHPASGGGRAPTTPRAQGDFFARVSSTARHASNLPPSRFKP